MTHCITCQHIAIRNEQPDWSDVTPGSPFEFYCNNSHWELDTHHDSLATLREYMDKANDCVDYELFTQT